MIYQIFKLYSFIYYNIDKYFLNGKRIMVKINHSFVRKRNYIISFYQKKEKEEEDDRISLDYNLSNVGKHSIKKKKKKSNVLKMFKVHPFSVLLYSNNGSDKLHNIRMQFLSFATLILSINYAGLF